jgi:myo-inositol-1(or 4)-monophosphatase
MEYYDFAIEAVREAGSYIKKARTGVVDILQKGSDPRDEITKVDLDINNLLIKKIQDTFPEHKVSSEEGTSFGDKENKYEWTLDPIDGTSNFARGIPHFATCVSLLENGVPIVGAVYNPVTDELFSFEKEKGSFLNEKEIHASSITDTKETQVLFHLGGRREDLWDWGMATKRSLLEPTKKMQSFGSSALDLCFLASGRSEIVIYTTMTTYDVAGAIGMVRIAGGEVHTIDGEPVSLLKESQTVIATANKELFENIQPFLNVDLYPR